MPAKDDMTKTLFIALFSALLGFSVSQIGVVGEVKANAAEIQHLKNKDADLDKYITSVSATANALIQQNQEFINLLKVQNELLMQCNKK